MKIGILTYFGAHNYGAFLQAYALRQIVSEIIAGEVELINYRTLQEIKVYSANKLSLLKLRYRFSNLQESLYNELQYKTFEKCITKYQIISKEKLISDSIEDFSNYINNKYYLIIVGSDEIWKTDGFRKFPNAYWLPNINCKKMAYAVSSRNNIDKLTDSDKVLIKKYCESFSYIGLRDNSTLDLIAKLSNCSNECYLNCDPTFLYDFKANKENGRRILIEKFKAKSNKRIIGLILSDKHVGNTICDYLQNEFEMVSLSSYIEKARNYGGLTPFEWIDVIASCDMIITSRFHGTIFSIKNSRPLLAIDLDEHNQDYSKLFDLLNRNELNHFYVKRDETITNALFKRIDDFVTMSQQLNYAMDYTKTIESEIKLAKSFYDDLQENVWQLK